MVNGGQHRERMEEKEVSSAGWETEHLNQPSRLPGPPVAAHLAMPNTTVTPAPYAGNRNNILGIALIAVGFLFWATRIGFRSSEMTAGMILLTIASPLLFFAFWRRIYPLMIPGLILVGLSIGVPFAELTHGISVLWGLALGFVGIYLLGRELFNIRNPWPMIPAVPLFAVGIIVAIASLPTFFAAGFMWLPLLLIGAGLYLGWGRRP